jgi:hypothetical protein
MAKKRWSDRTFGVELEIIGLGEWDAVQALRSANLKAFSDNEDEGGCECDYDYTCDYCLHGTDSNESAHSTWTVKEDGSIDPWIDDSGDGTCCEVVSPILKGAEGLKELRTACTALVRAGATVNHTCGLHVHIGASDLSVGEIVDLVKRYSLWEEDIDACMHPTRRGENNTYCGPVKDTLNSFARNLASHNNQPRCWSRSYYNHEVTDDTVNPNIVGRLVQDRYRKVNLNSLARYGTIEFRHHNGAVSPDTVCNWVQFVLAFTKRSVALSRAKKAGKVIKERSVFSGIPKELADFYKSRMMITDKVPEDYDYYNHGFDYSYQAVPLDKWA